MYLLSLSNTKYLIGSVCSFITRTSGLHALVWICVLPGKSNPTTNTEKQGLKVIKVGTDKII